MDPVHRFFKPDLQRPWAMVALEGWGDACDAASGALAYVLGQHDVEPFAAIDPEEFFDFQVRRPVVEIDEGGTRGLSWPVTRFYGLRRDDWPSDLIVVLGEEPNMRWKTYARTLIQVLADAGVERVITLAAFVGQVAHTLPVPIIGVATDPDEVADHGLLTSHYEGPTAILSVILEACREAGISGLSLWAATPHYLAANSNPKAMLALLENAGRVSGIEVDTSELAEVASEFEQKVDEAMKSSDDLTAYVRRLEETGIENGDLRVDEDAGEQLISDIEQFLRNQR